MNERERYFVCWADDLGRVWWHDWAKMEDALSHRQKVLKRGACYAHIATGPMALPPEGK